MSHRRTILMGFAPLLLAIVNVACSGTKKEEEAAKPQVAVRVAKAEVHDVPLTVQAPATVFPREQASIASRITAPILSLGARKGDRVSAGQVLARLDNRDLIAQRKEIAALVTDANASLEKMRSGTVPADLERARGQVATTQATLSQAEKFYERRKHLFDQGAIPNRDLLVSQTDLATARTNFEVAQRGLALLEKQSTGRDIEIFQSRLEQARGRLSVIDTQIAFSELRSPFGGTVTEQFVFPGDMAQPSTPMFVIADLSIAVARAQVPEQEVRSVRVGSPCRLTPQDQKDRSYPGKVSIVNQSVDPGRRTVEVWCDIPNPNGDLRAQVFGTVEVVAGNLASVVTVPVAAIEFEEGTRNGHVMVVEGNRAKKRQVEAGATSNGRVPIRKGLAAGETVIIEGGYGLPEGIEVKTQ